MEIERIMSHEGLGSRNGLVEADFIDYQEEIVEVIEGAKLSAKFAEYGERWVTYWVEGKMVGCVTFERRDRLVHLQSLAVDKRNRRMGVARELVGYVFDNYVNSGEALTALTLFWNVKIYEKMGFTRVDAAEMKRVDDVAGREKHKHCAALIKLKE